MAINKRTSCLLWFLPKTNNHSKNSVCCSCWFQFDIFLVQNEWFVANSEIDNTAPQSKQYIHNEHGHAYTGIFWFPLARIQQKRRCYAKKKITHNRHTHALFETDSEQKKRSEEKKDRDFFHANAMPYSRHRIKGLSLLIVLLDRLCFERVCAVMRRMKKQDILSLYHTTLLSFISPQDTPSF